MNEYHIILYYKYVSLINPEKEKEKQQAICKANSLDGRILLSSEGINGTLSGSSYETIQNYVNYLCQHPIFQMKESDFKHSNTKSIEKPFPYLQVRIKKEVVSTGYDESKLKFPNMNVESKEERGYLTPEEFHKAIEEGNDDIVLLDVRNHYEYSIGHFDNAIDPMVRTFSEYLEYIKKKKNEFENKKVLMYCTGGIRCEKASDFLRKECNYDTLQGNNNIFHLQGGIHKYLQQYPDGGYFKGKNFVFDKRIAINANSSDKNTIIGKCIECNCDYDELSPFNLCTVCRDMVLTCPKCITKLNGELHCKKHTYLKECYFTFLQFYAKDELLQQLTKLKDLHRENEYNPEWKRKRKMLRKQIEKIECRINDFDSGVVCVPEKRIDGVFHCRSCFQLGCNGRCWGYWVDDDGLGIDHRVK